MEIIVSMIWIIMSMFVMAQIAPYCKNLPFYDKFIVAIICFLLGPTIIMSDVTASLLDYFLPEDWDGGII